MRRRTTLKPTRRPGNLLLFPEVVPVQAAVPQHGARDQAARDAALDPTRSLIVQAPAGAGKTELLTQRYLALLAQVDEPEEILAITFTRAATAEMRGRILAALEHASALHDVPAQAGESRATTLARAALAHAEQRGWQLLAQPHRLDVQTIDSLCMRLAHGQPLLARLGGRLEPTEQAAALYTLAARRTIEQLGRTDGALEQALRHLLLSRDNNLGECQRLLARLLERREQWRHIFVLSEGSSVDWEAVRARLEEPFAVEVHRVLGELHAVFSAEPALVDELLTLARYACSCGSESAIALLDGMPALPEPHADLAEHWTCVRNFLLTQNGEWRRRVNKKHGFPADGGAFTKLEQQRWKERMAGLIEALSGHPAGERLRNLLCAVPSLPAARYDEAQWDTLQAIFAVLRHAIAELHVVFAETNQVDFAELSIAAATVLDDEESDRGLLASEVRRHLLIDEFQDTSRRQHQLIGRLLREWQPGDGRTCFLVGDPMQSIYIFRQAEVELFGRVQRRGLDCGSHAHPCAALTLTENFRSHAGLVDPLNQYFETIFTAAGDDRGEVPFSPSTAAAPAPPGESVVVHGFFARSGPEARRGARASELDRVVAIVEGELPRIAEAKRRGDRQYTVAVLGRAKNHLAPIAEALRERAIPFRAIELEALGDRQEILDLKMLLRALLHPADRIAWLSVLRAPWCGLTLGDLHRLTGSDDRAFRTQLVPELIRGRAQLLSPDGRERLARVSAVLGHAVAERFEAGRSLTEWLERTWVSLGAPAYLSAPERENAEVFFSLLEQLPGDGVDVWNGTLDAALARLCAAPDASVDEQFGVQLMTIHKAKGLGFEVVIVPALERSTGSDDSPLITVMERARQAPEAAEEVDEVLVAPLGQRGDKHRTYTWVQAQRRRRQASERKRVFYVACTRARRTLHLLGIADQAADGTLRPGKHDGLLACAWPALEPLFVAQRSSAAESAAGQQATPAVIERLAAGVEAPDLPLERVPSNFAARLLATNVTASGTYSRNPEAEPAAPLFARPAGSPERRARGTALHAMLELVAEAWAREGRVTDPALLRHALRRLAGVQLRQAGLAADRAEALSPELVRILLAAVASEPGNWILAPHPAAASEWSLSTWSADQSRLRTVRVDRVFRAGVAPLTWGEECLWIIDYKSGGEADGITADAYVEDQKTLWRPQLEAYGAALRAMRGEQLPQRYALFFPELQRLAWWREENNP